MATDWNIWGTIKQAAGLWFRKDGYALKVTPTGTTLTADRTINLPNANADTTLATIDGIQTLTNKAIDGGTASANNKLKLPEDTYANLVSLAGKTEGQIFYANDVDKVYYYNGTALIEVGSGSGTGKKNYILNPSAATDVSKWTASNFTATKDTSTSIPRETTTGTAFKLVSTNTAATFLSDAMLLDDTDLSKKLGVEIAINVADASNWTIDILASATAGGTYARLPLSTDVAAVTTLPATIGVFKTTVDTVAATPYIKFRITSAATAKTAYFSDILVTPDGNTVVGPVIEEWKSYTPTGSWTANTGYSGKYRRVASVIELNISIYLTGRPTAGVLNFTAAQLLNGLNLNYLPQFADKTGEVKQVAGNWVGTNQATADYIGTVNIADAVISNPVFALLYQLDTAATSGVVTDVLPFSWDVNDNINLQVSFPIAEWANSGTVNLAQNDEEYASNSDTSDATNTSAFVYGPGGSSLPGSLTAQRLKRVKFASPIQVTDLLTLEAQVGTGEWFPVTSFDVYSGLSALQNQNTTRYGMGITSAVTNGNEVDVAFGTYCFPSGTTFASAGTSWSTITGKWRVRKTSGGKAIGFSHVVPGVSAGLVPAAGLPGRTDGVAVGAGYVGEASTIATWSATANTSAANVGTLTSLGIGNWIILLSCHGYGTAGYRSNISISTTSATQDTSNQMVFTAGTGSNNNGVTCFALINNTVARNIYAVATSPDGTVTLTGRMQAVRIA